MSPSRTRLQVTKGLPPMTCPVCGGELVPGQNIGPLLKFTRYDVPKPHPVLSKPLILRGIVATNGESRHDLTLHEQLQQRAAMGGPTERQALAAFRTIFAQALASALVAKIRNESQNACWPAEPVAAALSRGDDDLDKGRLRDMDARGPWTGHLTKPALEMSPTIEEILAVLNRHCVRATYAAVGEVMRVPARSVSRWLGERRPAASWVVARQTLRPSGYTEDELHPGLSGSRVVTTGAELRQLLETEAAR